MQTAEADFSGIEHLLNSRHQRDADTVVELNQVEPEFGFDFAQHRVAAGMASGIPAGRKRDHAKQPRRRAVPVFRRWAFLRLPVASILGAREQARTAQSQRNTPQQSPAPCAYRLDRIIR